MDIEKQIERLLKCPLPWSQKGEMTAGNILYSKIELMRNIKGYLFPSSAGHRDLLKIHKHVRPVAMLLTGFKRGCSIPLDGLGAAQRRILTERHYIGKKHCPEVGSELFVSYDGRNAVLLNQENHIHLCAFQPGLALDKAWKKSDSLDNLLSQEFEFAFKPEIGYLTTGVNSMGTGLRATVALHVPALILAGHLPGVGNCLDVLGFDLRHSETAERDLGGGILHLSNRIAHGRGEAQIIESVAEQARRISQLEENARQLLLENQPEVVFDYVSRAYGLLRFAYNLPDQELMEHLSAVRLGLTCEMFSTLDRLLVSDLALNARSGHLSHALPSETPESREDIERARLVRNRLRML